MSLYPAPEESGFYGHVDKKIFQLFYLIDCSENKQLICT